MNLFGGVNGPDWKSHIAILQTGAYDTLEVGVRVQLKIRISAFDTRSVIDSRECRVKVKARGLRGSGLEARSGTMNGIDIKYVYDCVRAFL